VVLRRQRKSAHLFARVTPPARQVRFGQRRYWRPAPAPRGGVVFATAGTTEPAAQTSCAPGRVGHAWCPLSERSERSSVQQTETRNRVRIIRLGHVGPARCCAGGGWCGRAPPRKETMRCACNPVGAAATRAASWGRAFPIRREYAYKEGEHATIACAMRKMAVLAARNTSVSVRAFHDLASKIRTSTERTSNEYRSDGAVLCPWWI
jgi:hypothetical protein